MSVVSGPHSKELKKRLASAREALAAGDGAGARCLTREALALDDTSYDAWVFDGESVVFFAATSKTRSNRIKSPPRSETITRRRVAAPSRRRSAWWSSLL